ncbi:MAG: DUF4012 domain-containing protein [Candidatus Paceibacterota bacterium]
MSRLETLPASQNQRVLLIGAQQWLFSLITERFSAYDFQVVELTEADFLRIDQQELDSETIYKIIWWMDFLDLETKQLVAESFQSIKNIPLIILGKLPESFLLEAEELSRETIATRDFFISITEALTTAQLFFVRDLIEDDDLVEAFKFVFRGYQKNILLDPQAHWFFCTQQDFFQAIEPYLVRPHSAQKALIQGKKIISSVVLKKMADLLMRYYSLSFKIVPVIAERHSPPLPGFVEATLQSRAMDFIDKFIRQKELWEKTARALPFPTEKYLNQDFLEISDHQQADSASSVGKVGESQAEKQSQSEKQESSPSKDRLVQQIDFEDKRLINSVILAKQPKKEENIEGELARIFHQQRNEKKQKRIGAKVKIIKKVAQKSQKNKTLFFGGMATMAMGGVVLLFWGILFISSIFARRELTVFFTTNSPETKRAYQPDFWTRTLITQTDFYQGFLASSWLGASGELAEFSQDFSQLDQQQAELKTLGGQYLLSLLNGGETSSDLLPLLNEKLSEVQNTTNQVVGSAELVLSGLIKPDNGWLTIFQKTTQNQALILQLPDLLSTVFGGNGKRTYAVLLQNNLELRPTGGFIQAIGFITFDNGLLIDSQIVSPYDLDQRVLASVLAPTEIRKYLGEDNWYLRDSNWNPDFPETALRVSWFIHQATGLQVDGVWGINYLALKEMLKAVGPLELANYSELLTEKNLLERVEFHSDDELIGVKNKQQDYALVILTQFLQQLRTMSPEQATAFLETLQTSLANKQVLVSLFEQEQGDLVEKIGWNGQIINPICPSQFSQVTCLVDQIFQVETNVGLNRVGTYIKREVEHRVDLSGEKIVHTRSIRLENTSRSDGWPLGSYKAYLRFISDSESQPTSIKIDGRKITSDQLMIYGEGGRRVVGVPVEVPKQTTVTIEFSYTTKAVPQGSFAYLLFDQQQSGIEETPTQITIYNSTQKPTLVAPQAEFFGDSVEFNQIKNEHLFVGVRY